MFGIIKKILSRLLFYLVGGLTFIATIFLFSLDENLTYSFISFLLFALGIVLFMMASMAVLTGQVVSTILWRTEDIPIDKLTVKIKKKDYPAEYWKVLLQYIFYSILCRFVRFRATTTFLGAGGVQKGSFNSRVYFHQYGKFGNV